MRKEYVISFGLYTSFWWFGLGGEAEKWRIKDVTGGLLLLLCLHVREEAL